AAAARSLLAGRGGHGRGQSRARAGARRDGRDAARAVPAGGARRRPSATPRALYRQGTRDVAHPRPDLDRFVAGYRKAGGQVELELYEGEAEGFINRNPGSPAAAKAVARIVEFVHKQLGSSRRAAG